ncbi:MAG: hypothetical protein ABW321_04835 [Polyangiales bacterium]
MVITDAVVDFLGVARSVSIGTCDARKMPFATRAAALRARPDRVHVSVFLAEQLAAAPLRHVAETGRLAVQVSNPLDHRTVQLKGQVVGTGPAPEADRDFIEHYLAELALAVDQLGMPRERVMRMSHWPAIVLELQVAEVFLQTPGPGAGTRLAGRTL